MLKIKIFFSFLQKLFSMGRNSKLNLLWWYWLINLHRFQVCISMTHHLCISLCAHHPKLKLHAKQNNSDRKKSRTMILLICGIWNWKQQINKTRKNKQNLIHTDIIMVTRGKRGGRIVKGKGGQTYGDGRIFDFEKFF